MKKAAIATRREIHRTTIGESPDGNTPRDIIVALRVDVVR